LIEGSRERVEKMMWANIALVDNEATVHLTHTQPLPAAVQPERFKLRARFWAFGIATAAIAACAFLFGMRFDRKIHPPIPSDAPVVAQLPVRPSATIPPPPIQRLPSWTRKTANLPQLLGQRERRNRRSRRLLLRTMSSWLRQSQSKPG
jgi:negative regulator of sigma E activity